MVIGVLLSLVDCINRGVGILSSTQSVGDLHMTECVAGAGPDLEPIGFKTLLGCC